MTVVAPPPLQPPPAAPSGPRTSVADAIAAMAAAVQRGDFAGAEAAGAAAEVHLALPKQALRDLAPLSDGAQACVFSAQLAPECAHLVPGLDPAAPGGLAVAVKRAHIRNSADLDRFRREAALLAQLRHPHIARLLGARLLPPGYQMVLQLEATSAASELHSAGWRPAWPRLLRLAAQLAAALAHMHAAGCVHRDIKPANVLLNAARDAARLADLGLAAAAAELAEGAVSHAKPTGGFHKQRMVGTLEYMAPEVLLGSPHSPASDVFALAVTVNELATGQLPYSDCTRDNPLAHTILEMGYGRQELAAAVAAEGLRPTLAPGTPAPLRLLLQGCWARQPGERPAAGEVASALEGMARAAEAAAAEVAAEVGAEAGEACRSSKVAAAAQAPPAPSAAQEAGQPASQQQERQRDMPGGAAAEASRDADMPDAAGLADAASAAPAPGGPTAGGLPAWLAAGGAAASAPVFTGSFLTAGKRDQMEDMVVVLPDAFGTAGAPGCTAVGVFDGHRGASAAEFLTHNLQQLLSARLHAAAVGAGQLLAGALADADVAYRAQQDAVWAVRLARMGAAAAGARPAPGSTATLVLVYPRRQPGQAQAQQALAVANLGDSRVVLCRDGQAVQLTRDHTAELPNERRRVAAAGGACAVRAGGWRVGAAGLQVTRSIGDADLKGEGVSAEAEVAEVALTPRDAFFIAATDGLWDRVSNEDAVALVQDTVKHPGMCAQRLVLEALARGSTDNIAAVVAFLNSDGSTVERVYDHGQLKYGGAAAAAARRKAAAATPPSADELQDTY